MDDQRVINHLKGLVIDGVNRVSANGTTAPSATIATIRPRVLRALTCFIGRLPRYGQRLPASHGRVSASAWAGSRHGVCAASTD